MAFTAATTARLLVTAAAVACTAAIGFAQPVHADSLGYLVNVTMRPGYNFPNADAALSYGYGLCEQIGSGVRYGQLVNSIKSDFATDDEVTAWFRESLQQIDEAGLLDRYLAALPE